MAAPAHRLVDCPICGLDQAIGVVPAGSVARCLRCNTVLLRRSGTDPDLAAFCYALAAVLLFWPAYALPILEVTTLGQTRSYTVLSGVNALWHESMWPLAVPVALASALLPLALIVLLLAYPWLRRIGIGAAWLRPWERLCDVLRAWAIVDVYLLAIFVTVVKLAQLTDAAPGLGAAMLFAMVLCLTLALRNLDSEGPDPITAKAAMKRSQPPAPGSAARTFALAMTAMILFVPANLYATLTVHMRGTTEAATVYDGVLDLWRVGMWPLAIIVACASLLIPFVKIIGLMFLTLTLHRRTDRKARTRLYVFISTIGRWSMLDVYVISLIVAVLHFGALGQAHAEIGALAFVAVVIVTLAAARSFDPRLIWHPAAAPADPAPLHPAR